VCEQGEPAQMQAALEALRQCVLFTQPMASPVWLTRASSLSSSPSTREASEREGLLCVAPSCDLQGFGMYIDPNLSQLWVTGSAGFF
jgi:hypothetical protein